MLRVSNYTIMTATRPYLSLFATPNTHACLRRLQYPRGFFGSKTASDFKALAFEK